MNLSFCKKMAYENKYNWTLGENKPNQTQFFTPLFRVLYTLKGGLFSAVRSLSSVLRPLFPDEAVFSVDLVARPVILNPNIRQLRHRWKANTFEPFKARKETYHVY